MFFVKGRNLLLALVVLTLVFGFGNTLFGQEKPKCLTVQHEITTTGLPLVGPVVVYNTQEFMGDRVSRSMRALTMTLGDSVLSDVVVVVVTDLEKKKQIYINPKTKTYTEKAFDPSEFSVIDTLADARGPQLVVKKTGKTREIDGKKCSEIYFKLDIASNTGVGDAKIKHYFEGNIWVTKDIPNYELYLDYNVYALQYFRGSRYAAGGFFDILGKLDVDDYNLVNLASALEGVPVEAAFVAQMPSGAGGDVFETKIKLIEYSADTFKEGYFGPPTEEGYKKVAPKEFESF